MTRRLPPLNALRAFEAAARHMSFAKAAEELSVTAAAVSHQIKLLEGILGTRLFTRTKHSVQLTDAARLCLPHLSNGFDHLAAAVETVQRHDDSGHLRVAVASSFAAKWLVPRLNGFHAAHPKINVELVVSDGDATSPLDIDAAITYGGVTPAGFRADPLLAEHLVTVCAPALLDALKGPPSPADLARLPLLHDTEPPEEEVCRGWGAWFAAFGIRDIDPRRGSRFNRSALAVDAAVAGQGVALTRRTIAAGALASGRLVVLFGPGVPTRRMHRFLCPTALAHSPRVRALSRWLRREAVLDGVTGAMLAGQPCDEAQFTGGNLSMLSPGEAMPHHAVANAKAPLSFSSRAVRPC